MKALVIVAHGSRRQASNQEVADLTQKLAEQNNHFDQVSCAFLELAEPSIPQGLINTIQQGADHITVLPYFLCAGRHVVEDIPAEIAKVTQQYPDIDIHLSDYLGKAPEMIQVMIQQAQTTLD